MNQLSTQDFASYFDATNLSLYAPLTDIDTLCQKAHEFGCASVMVYPDNIKRCQKNLEYSPVKVGTVIGFPSGRTDMGSKASEIQFASAEGCDEADIVMPYNRLKQGEIKHCEDEISALVSLCQSKQLLSKIIVETCYLTEEEKLEALRICEAAGANFIKTSTGFGSAGASVEDIALFQKNRKTSIQIKAAGGMKSYQDALAMIDAGAARLGASKAFDMINAFAK